MKPAFVVVFSVPAQFYSAFTALTPYITQTYMRGLCITEETLVIKMSIVNNQFFVSR